MFADTKGKYTRELKRQDKFILVSYNEFTVNNIDGFRFFKNTYMILFTAIETMSSLVLFDEYHCCSLALQYCFSCMIGFIIYLILVFSLYIFLLCIHA